MKKILLSLNLILFAFILIACKDDEVVVTGKITLNHANITVTAGSSSSTVLFATLTDVEGEIEWKSSDSSIVTVTPDSNPTAARVSGVSAGSAVITVSVGKVFAETIVTVIQGEFLTVESEVIGVEMGKTTMINVTAHTTNITFTSANESIATVNNSGLVNGVGEGSTTITIKAGSKTAYVIVTVEESGIDILEKDDIVISFHDNKFATLTALGKGGVNPANGIWKIDDESVAAITQEGAKVTIEALESGISKSTIIRFTMNGFIDITRKVTVKDVDLELDANLSNQTLTASTESTTVSYTITPEQTGDRNNVVYSADPADVVIISATGVITRNPNYRFLDDEVLVNITVSSVIDPEASKTLNLVVENPLKGVRFISDVETFNQVMTSANNSSIIYLVADIDLGGRVYTNTIMPGHFNGSFNGNGYTISNFTAPSIFGEVSGKIENVGFVGNMTGSQRGFLTEKIASNGIVRNILLDITFILPAGSYAAGISLFGNVSNAIIISTNQSNTPIDQAYGVTIQSGTSNNVFLYNKEGTVNGARSTVVNYSQLLLSDTFTNFDLEIWKIEDGKIPSLIKK